jgi:hypothetical protein
MGWTASGRGLWRVAWPGLGVLGERDFRLFYTWYLISLVAGEMTPVATTGLADRERLERLLLLTVSGVRPASRTPADRRAIWALYGPRQRISGISGGKVVGDHTKLSARPIG